jgi:histone H3/H4
MSDHLVVASKIKKFIKQNSGLNTSAEVMEELSKIVRKEIQKAVEKAKKDNRKTVMKRDFEETAESASSLW